MDATTERTAPSERAGGEPAPKGEARGLPALYLQCMPEAVGLAYLLTGDGDVARDIADEAFVRGAGRFEHRLGRVRFPTWLRRSVVTVFLLRERRAELDPRGQLADDVDAEEEAEEPDSEDGVWPAVLTLPPRERAAVVLRECRGLSEEEVAAALRCNVRTARITVARGLEMLEPIVREP